MVTLCINTLAKMHDIKLPLQLNKSGKLLLFENHHCSICESHTSLFCYSSNNVTIKCKQARLRQKKHRNLLVSLKYNRKTPKSIFKDSAQPNSVPLSPITNPIFPPSPPSQKDIHCIISGFVRTWDQSILSKQDATGFPGSWDLNCWKWVKDMLKRLHKECSYLM